MIVIRRQRSAFSGTAKYLVGVHVALCPTSGLEDDKREMVGQLARDNLAKVDEKTNDPDD